MGVRVRIGGRMIREPYRALLAMAVMLGTLGLWITAIVLWAGD